MKLGKILSTHSLSNTLFKQILLIITFSILLIFALFNLDKALSILNYILLLFSPVLGGIAIAYVINILIKFLETRIFGFLTNRKIKFWEKNKKVICITLAFILILFFFWAILFMIIPQLISSVTLFVNNIPVYINTTYSMLLNFQQKTQNYPAFLLNIDWQSMINSLTDFITNSLKSLLSLTLNFTSGIINVVLSIIFSIYLLSSKDVLIMKSKQLLYAFISKETAKKTIDIFSLANKTFTGFVTGQFIEAFILGSLCYIGMVIFKFNYALLISVLVGVTSIIPIFGAYIGAIIGAFILFLVSPISALCFIVFLIILQQLENNIIYPKVVGNSIGLPGLWVLFAIIVFGKLFGIIGVLLGIPTFSVIYTLLETYTQNRLEIKGLSKEDIK